MLVSVVVVVVLFVRIDSDDSSNARLFQLGLSASRGREGYQQSTSGESRQAFRWSDSCPYTYNIISKNKFLKSYDAYWIVKLSNLEALFSTKCQRLNK
jgi:hypothetical protein